MRVNYLLTNCVGYAAVSADQNRTGGALNMDTNGDPQTITVSADQNRTGGALTFTQQVMTVITQCQPIRIEPGGRSEVAIKAL